MAHSIPEAMEAWIQQIGKREPFRKRVPIPKPDADGLLVKILAMGVCHSDCTIAAMDEPIPGMRMAFILGHEACGEIVQLGSNVKESEYAVGDKVAILIVPGCDNTTCPQCNRGLHAICRAPDSGNYGIGVSDGMFAEYIAIATRAA
ncbi:hypothetical protein B0A55_09289, partial [Friedmanniomyces simplex]